MKPYSPNTNLGRKVAVDDVHHRTADQPKKDANRCAKVLQHAARQNGKATIRRAIVAMILGREEGIWSHS